MEELMKALCTAWEDEWQGMVMGELRYSKGEGEADGPCEISWSGRKIIRIRAVKGTGRMEILLFPFSGKTEGKKREDKGTFWHTFPAEEVRSFSLALGDHNAIHQSAHPVVSGFQTAYALTKGKNFERIRIRFHHLLYAGDAVYLKKEGNTFYGSSQVLCFEAVME
ncbi:MaoC family dehydratase [uncultured Dialister sp.]|uniref:MaoC family dehydratase n=1 Tax=uncultured Dialister sp. TaxID=278064 RepID=UPI0026085C88|nr:MaoC family dehydratase [uncultured Dialister sp.]